MCQKTVFKALTYLICMVLISTPCSSEDEVDFMNLSLEELLSINVSVASTKAESISSTPAIVSSYKVEDLQQMGISSLKDLLDFIPGIVVQDSHIGTSQIAIRGLSENFNQKVLFLVDDVPYWMVSHSDIPIFGIPFSAIEKVEIIRGPGAVYYGTNASAGVIKVITKKSGPNKFEAFGNSNALFNASAYYHQPVGEKNKINFGFEFQADDGYDAYFPETVIIPPFPADSPTSGTITKKEEFNSFFAGFQSKHISAIVQHFESTTNGLGGAPVIMQPNELKYDGSLFHLEFHKSQRRVQYKIFSDMNIFRLKIPIENFVDGNRPGSQEFLNGPNYRRRTGANLDWAITDNTSFFFGAEHEVRYTGEYVRMDEANTTLGLQAPSEKVDESSLFGQVDFSHEKWRFLAGGRFTDNSESGNVFTPRGSIIYNINENRSIKLLYSEGINSPNYIQRKIFIPFVIRGSADLKPEKVQTIDLAYSYVTGKMLFVVNAYSLETKDIISRPTIGGINTFQNVQGFSRSGAEIDLQRVWEKKTLFANIAYNHEGDKVKVDDPDALNVPRWTASLGLNFRLTQQQQIGVSTRYLSERNQADALTLVNARYQLKFNHTKFYLGVNNLLDEDIYHPDVANNRISLIPGGDGATVQGGVSVLF